MANPGLGFDAAAFRAGIRTAMLVGMPVASVDQPTFFMKDTVSATGSHTLDSSGVPFDPTYQPTRTGRTTHQVDCAVEYQDGTGKIEAFGVIVPSKVVLTLLDEDYLIVKGFEFVVITGQKFFYTSTEPGQALLDVGIWRIHCRSEDEG